MIHPFNPHTRPGTVALSLVLDAPNVAAAIRQLPESLQAAIVHADQAPPEEPLGRFGLPNGVDIVDVEAVRSQMKEALDLQRRATEAQEALAAKKA